MLNWTRDFLRDKRIEQPQLCAQLLLAHALGCERLELYVRFEAVPDRVQLDAFRELVREAGLGRPIAHLIGRKEFFSLDFRITPEVLVPRPETETLVETALEIVRASGRPLVSILELCTGSGCVACAVASQLPEVRLVATDVSPEAVEVARGNIARHGFGDRIELRQGDLYEALEADSARFGVILANPPYVKTSDLSGMSADVARHEPTRALDGGSDGLEVVRRIVGGAADRLDVGGWLAVEIGYDQAATARELCSAAGLSNVRLVKDGLGHERVIAGQRS